MADSDVTTADEPDDYWADDPRAPLEDWRFEVANDDTRLGYHAWRDVRVEILREICRGCGNDLSQLATGDARPGPLGELRCDDMTCMYATTAQTTPPPSS